MFFEHKVDSEKAPRIQNVSPRRHAPPSNRIQMLIQMLTPLDVSESKPGTEKF